MITKTPEKASWVPLPGSWEEAIPTWEEQVDGFYHKRKYKRALQQKDSPEKISHLRSLALLDDEKS